VSGLDTVDRMKVEVRPGDIVIRRKRFHGSEATAGGVKVVVLGRDFWEARCMGSGKSGFAGTTKQALAELEKQLSPPRNWLARRFT
jgi:hypothetical protein